MLFSKIIFFQNVAFQLFRNIAAIKNFSFSRSGCSVELSFWKRSSSENITAAKSGCSEKKRKTAAAPKKYLVQKCNCCVQVVTLKKCEKLASPKIKLSCKSCNTCERWNRYLKKKKKQIILLITFNWNYFPERFPHSGKYTYEIHHVYWLERRKKLCYVRVILSL